MKQKTNYSRGTSNTIKIAKVFLPKLMRKIRKADNRQSDDRGWIYFNLLPRSNKDKRRYPFVGINTVGCSHTKNGGCTMCHYKPRNNSRPIGNLQLKKNIDEAINFLEKANKEFDDGVYLITTGGSFFDDNEIPAKLRNYIFNRIKKNVARNKRMLFATESRLEFISKNKLIEMRNILGDEMCIEIGFGIESTKPLIREGCINKGFPNDFEDKISLLKKYKIVRTAHVLVKPPFISEIEAIEDAVKSVQDIFKRGWGEKVILMTMNSRPHTLIGELESKGRYRLPSIWTTIEIIKRLGPEICKNMMFHGFLVSRYADNNDPIKNVIGCRQCNSVIMPKLLRFKKPTYAMWRDLIATGESINCLCKADWLQRIQKRPQSSLEKRILHHFDILSREYFGKSLIDFTRLRI